MIITVCRQDKLTMTPKFLSLRLTSLVTAAAAGVSPNVAFNELFAFAMISAVWKARSWKSRWPLQKRKTAA